MSDEYKDLNVMHFKLSSGDEILGLVAGLDHKKGVVHIEYPVLIEQIGKSYMMLDYMPTSVKNIVVFNANHIIAQSDVHDSVKQEYIKYCIGSTTDTTDDDLSDFEVLNEKIDKSKYH